MKRIGIISYGSGNINSISQCLKILDTESKLVNNFNDMNDCSHLIIPGVGLFDKCLDNLYLRFEKEKFISKIRDESRPILGICIGMHLLAKSSEEGKKKGFNLIPGQVYNMKSFKDFGDKPLPHMGWNSISLRNDSKNPLKIKHNSRFYFIHSYSYKVEKDEHIYCETNYGTNFTSAVFKDNIFGVQFHPEKSHKNGLDLFKNFIDIKC